MPDRVIRDELLDSDRWLNLGHDSERLVFIGLLLRCDDFGNMEAGAGRLFRFVQSFTQVKSQENVAAILQHLADADLIRLYQSEGRELIHIPRLRPHRQYLVRRCPPSPWCDTSVPLGKTKRIINKGIAANVVTTSLKRSNDVAQGVGVGVGENTRTRTRLPVDNFSASGEVTAKSDGNKLPKVNGKGQFTAALGKALGSAARPGESMDAYRQRLRDEQESRRRESA